MTTDNKQIKIENFLPFKSLIIGITMTPIMQPNANMLCKIILISRLLQYKPA